QFPLPLIRIAVWLEGITSEWVLVPFVVDTGATHTCVHPLDATRLLGMSAASLDAATWPRVEASSGIGGGANYLTTSALYAVMHDDHPTTPPEIITGSIEIGELTAESQTLPSLLGWDVLQHFRVTAEWRGQVTLERRASAEAPSVGLPR
ncbi:MAG TPA: hypothetical protein VN697_15300, partial [Tepidiformaceae bacterium]|nr:hypothetical protein [Tepidiformaceae bacterium]